MKSLKFNSPIFDSYNFTIYENDLSSIKKHFTKIFSVKNTKYVERRFNEFFEKVVAVSKDTDVKKYLIDNRESLLGYFYSFVVKELFPLLNVIKKSSVDFKKIQIDTAIHILFFFAELTFSSLQGNIEDLSRKLASFKGKGKRTSLKYKQIINAVKKLREEDENITVWSAVKSVIKKFYPEQNHKKYYSNIMKNHHKELSRSQL